MMKRTMIRRSHPDWIKPLSVLVLLSFVMTACGGNPPSSTETVASPTNPLPSTLAPAASATPTALPKALNVCTAQEPESLYRYDGKNSESKKTIFSALYGGNIMNFDFLSSLLERMPSIENGDIKIIPARVLAGEMILDARGQLTVLNQGTQVIPFGCSSLDCVITWDGVGELEMPVQQVRYSLKDDLRWSDGEALSAEDVLFSFRMDGDTATPSSKALHDLTGKVSTDGNLVFVWQGIAGLIGQDPERFFWMPLPKHQLDGYSATQLLENIEAVSEPIGWGAYQLEKWEKGQFLLFNQNPDFGGAEVSTTLYESINLRIVPDLQTALQDFRQGTCDVLDSSYDLSATAIEGLSADIHFQVPLQVGSLIFGINPAAYDDGHVASDEERTDYFSDIRTRQAIALCINPEDLTEVVTREWLGSAAEMVVTSLNFQLPSTDPRSLLESVGWVDDDSNPNTPLVARGVENVTNLSTFEINLYIGQGDLDGLVAEEIAARLIACGIQVNAVRLPSSQLYAAGPEGILFGRKFDLAIVHWAGNYMGENHCEEYLTSQIPEAGNHWVGTNLAGYRDAMYDFACLTASVNSGEAAFLPIDDLLNQLLTIDFIPRFKVWVSQTGVDLP